MYSDGLIERRHTTLDTGISHLEAIAAAHAAEPLPDIADKIIVHMTDSSPTDDDIVLVCIRYLPQPSEQVSRDASALP